MHLTRFIRERTDVELERLARPDTWWHRMNGSRVHGNYKAEPGCLICNAFDCRTRGDYHVAKKKWDRAAEAEYAYMEFARRNGELGTGEMVARLARREMRRRALAAADRLLSEMQPPVEPKVETVP